MTDTDKHDTMFYAYQTIGYANTEHLARTDLSELESKLEGEVYVNEDKPLKNGRFALAQNEQDVETLKADGYKPWPAK